MFFKPVRVTTHAARRGDDAVADGRPASQRRRCPPGIDTAKLRQAVDAAFANPAGLTAAFVVVHKGRIVAERYANGAHKDMQLESWSMGKSITGTLDRPAGPAGRAASSRIPRRCPSGTRRRTTRAPKIRVMDLMRMSSGLRFSRGSPEDIPGYHDHDLIYTGAIDAFQFVDDAASCSSSRTRSAATATRTR